MMKDPEKILAVSQSLHWEHQPYIAADKEKSERQATPITRKRSHLADGPHALRYPHSSLPAMTMNVQILDGPEIAANKAGSVQGQAFRIYC